MSRFLLDLASWYWWVSVVAVGILVNLASAYLKTPIDRFIGGWSSKRSSAVAARESELRRQAELIACNPELLALEIRGEAVFLLLSMLILVLLAVALGIAALVRSALPSGPLVQNAVVLTLLALSLGLLITALRAMTRAQFHMRRLRYVRQFLRKRDAV